MQINQLPSTSTVNSTDLLVKEQANGTTEKIAISDFVVNNLTSTSTTAPLSAAQGKALNDKIGQFSAVSFTPETGVTSNLFIRRYGRVVCVNGYLTATNAFGSTSTLLGVIESGNYPISPVRFIAGVSSNAYSAGDFAYGGISDAGNVTITAKAGNTYKVCYFSVSYVVQS